MQGGNGYGGPPGYGPPPGAYGSPPGGGYDPPPGGGYGAPPGYAPNPYGPPAGGYGFGPPPPPPAMMYQQPAKCTRATYILLGIFLGGLGVHNFVAGRVGSGIAQLLLVLFGAWLIVPVFAVWIWVIIELIVVTHDGNGVKMA